MGTTREIIDEGTEGTINLGPERPRVYSELSQEEKDSTWANATENKMMWMEPFPHTTGQMILWLDVKSLHQQSVYEKPVRSYDWRVLSEVQAHDHYQDAVCDHHEEHEMHDDVRPNHVVDSHADYTSDSNMTSYDQNTVVNNSLNAELATYKEQVELYERGPDIVKMKAEALKEHNTRPIKALTVYPPNTPATLVPRSVLWFASNSRAQCVSDLLNAKAHHVVKTRCLELEVELSDLRDDIRKDNYNDLLNRFSNLEETHSELDRPLDLRGRDFQISQLTEEVNSLQEQNELFRVENAKIKQHYKELYDSIKISRAKHTEQTTALKRKYALDVEPIPPRNRNNREVHLVYLRHLKESVDTLRDIVERSNIATTPRKKQVTFEDQIATSSSTTHKHVEPRYTQKSNVPVPPSTGVSSCTDASGSQPRSILKKHRIPPAKSDSLKKVEDHSRIIRSSLRTTNRVDSSISSKRTVINSHSHSVCQTCNKCLFSANHDMCVVTYLNSVNASPNVKIVVRHVKQVWKPKQVTQVRKPTGKTRNNVGYQWRPTGRTFTLSDQCPLTRFTKLTRMSAIACANQSEPNQHWGSNFPNSPSSSVFKCRSYKSSFDTMTDAEHAPAMELPVRTDEQIMPRNRWMPIGKSNCYLNEEKSQRSPIFKIAVDILKQTNFFRAFTASSTIPAIYIQQFWDTIRFDSKAGSYKCQLDEQWFNLNQDTLRDALQITPVDNNRAFSSPPTPDTLVEFVNKLGYPKEVMHLSNVTTNDMFQPWRALATIINLCLTGKTSGFERPRAPVLQILWGIVNRAHIDYAERMWEEFTQSIHTFTEDKRKLAQHTLGKKKATLILIPSIRFTKLIIFHLQRLHKFHPRPDSPLHLPTEEPVLADYYDDYLEKNTKHQRYIAGEELSDPDSPAPKPAKPTKQAKPNATEQPIVSKSKAKKSKLALAKPKEKKRKPCVSESFLSPTTKPIVLMAGKSG
ncbi:hypothetical protein Tco_1156889 [Tanacetum coccineum]